MALVTQGGASSSSDGFIVTFITNMMPVAYKETLTLTLTLPLLGLGLTEGVCPGDGVREDTWHTGKG